MVNSLDSTIEVTIGLCVKNSAETVQQAINSILNQDYSFEKMELIIVDGNSKDGTLEILKNSLMNKQLQTMFISDTNGLGAARQLVVNKASGNFVIWVDSDMIISQNFITCQVQFMNNHPNAGIAKGKYELGVYQKEIVAVLENVEFFLGTFSVGKTEKSLGTSGCIYRLAAIRQIGGFDLKIKGAGEDTDAENRLRAAGWDLYVSTALFQELRRNNWKSLWVEYFWLGQGGKQVVEKDWRAIEFYKMLPPVAVFSRFVLLPKAYKITHRKVVLLLPVHYIFKRIAWFFGFSMSARKHEL
ncbi:MAG: glycosyltransferase [Candidatus Bathyarchaeia archaeon]